MTTATHFGPALSWDGRRLSVDGRVVGRAESGLAHVRGQFRRLMAWYRSMSAPMREWFLAGLSTFEADAAGVEKALRPGRRKAARMARRGY